jgi:hypothetical protein
MPYCHGIAQCNNWSLHMYSEKLLFFFTILEPYLWEDLAYMLTRLFNPWGYYMSQGPGLYQNMGPKDERWGCSKISIKPQDQGFNEIRIVRGVDCVFWGHGNKGGGSLRWSSMWLVPNMALPFTLKSILMQKYNFQKNPLKETKMIKPYQT